MAENNAQDETFLDGPAFAPERLTVRGKDLNDLVGSLSYPAAVYHLLTGDLPTPSMAHRLDAWLLAAMRSMTPDQPIAQLVRQSAAMGATDIGAVIAGLTLGDGLGLPTPQTSAGLDFSPLDELGLHAYREGLYYFAIAPLLYAYALSARPGADQEATTAPTLDEQRSRLANPALGYVDALFTLVSTQSTPTPATLALFNDVLVAFHAGLGTVAPTIALPRGATSTRVSTAMALAAGYTAAGPAHVGACKLVMGYFAEVVQHADSPHAESLTTHTRTMLDARLTSGERLAGFGHPLFRQDPRNPHLRDLAKAKGITSPYLVVYDVVAARMHELRAIHPNIDAIAAAIFLTLDIAPAYGSALFVCARMAAMVAHIEDARKTPAFGRKRDRYSR